MIDIFFEYGINVTRQSHKAYVGLQIWVIAKFVVQKQASKQFIYSPK